MADNVEEELLTMANPEGTEGGDVEAGAYTRPLLSSTLSRLRP